MRTITYSPAYTLVPTYECFNRCSYCNFRVDPGSDQWLTLAQARTQLQGLQATGTIEILILSGEVHPNSPRRKAWLQRIYDLCALALEMGFLPHTNAGPLSDTEMATLAQVNVSMGLMLEQLTPTLQTTVHRHAPNKAPELRLQQLALAGQLGIPFTTGVLLGIGETGQDWQASFEAIAQIQQQWRHIQEVILQPYSPGEQEALAQQGGQGFDVTKLPAVVALARQILPASITLQIPPNLVNQPDILLACLEAGARDLGGLVPHDHVNPSYAHLPLVRLKQLLAQSGWQLAPRLPVYPHLESLLPQQLQQPAQHLKQIATSHPNAKKQLQSRPE
jgi:7,8-didemethyl-8-hydroxy-5-deazariboflavin synthase